MVMESLRVNLTKREDALRLYPHDALSASANWDGVYLQYHRQPPHEMVEHSCLQHRIIIHDRALPSPMLATIDELTQPTPIGCGTITIVPASAHNWAYWNAEHQFMVLAWEADRLAQDVAEATDGNEVELLSTLGHVDPLIYNIGMALKTELESSGMGVRLYIDAMKSALLAHLLRYYSVQRSVQDAVPLAVTNRLSEGKLQQVRDYINEHLEQDLTLSELAAVVHMSSSYFSGSFKQSTGLAPHQYVIQCRVERAKQLLVQSKLSIAEIALQVGFAHQSHLSRHFKRLVGVTPKAFLRSQ